MTPEGQVKKKISAYLSTCQTLYSNVTLWDWMPVPSGYGKSGLDYILCINGLFVAIEAKAPGEWLTTRQRDTALGILRGRGKVFVISTDEGLEAFKRWMAWLSKNSKSAPPVGK